MDKLVAAVAVAGVVVELEVVLEGKNFAEEVAVAEVDHLEEDNPDNLELEEDIEAVEDKQRILVVEDKVAEVEDKEHLEKEEELVVAHTEVHNLDKVQESELEEAKRTSKRN